MVLLKINKEYIFCFTVDLVEVKFTSVSFSNSQNISYTHSKLQFVERGWPAQEYSGSVPGSWCISVRAHILLAKHKLPFSIGNSISFRQSLGASTTFNLATATVFQRSLFPFHIHTHNSPLFHLAIFSMQFSLELCSKSMINMQSMICTK